MSQNSAQPAAPSADGAESARLEALRAAGLLDGADTEALHDFPALAAAACGAPMAAISLLDDTCQHFVGRIGIEVDRTPRAIAFCEYTLAAEGVLEVVDARADPRFAGNPLVTGAPGIGAYAGIALRTASGHAIGTLFVADHAPRRLPPAQRDALARLARQAAQAIDRRTDARRLQRAQDMQAAIVAALGRVIDADRPASAFEGLLEDILRITTSEYGFIGEVHAGADGRPFLKTHAITDISWDETSRGMYEASRHGGMEFHRLDTLFGHAMTGRHPVIANDPGRDPRRGGLPPGHPPLDAFLGLPVMREGEMVGLLGLANRPQGYVPGLARELEPILAAIASMVATARTERERRRAEDALRASEQRLRDIADAMPGAMFRYVLNPDGTDAIEYMSRGSLALWERAPDSMQQDVSSLWAMTEPEDLPGLRDSVLASARDLSPWRHEWRIRTPSGKLKWVVGTGTPRRRADGAIEWSSLNLDRTAQEMAKQALARSEARYRAIAENIPGAIFRYLLHPDGRHAVEYISPGAQAIWEHAPAAIEADAQHLFRAIAPEDRDAFRDSLLDSARTLALWQYRWRILTPSGRHKWLQRSGRPVLRENGDIAWDGYVFDVTERREAEAALALSEARLRVLVETSPDAIVVLDTASGRFVDHNGRACALLGTDPETLLRGGPVDFSPALQPDGRSSAEAGAAAIARAAAGEDLTFEWMHQRADGTPVPCEVHLSRIPDASRVLIRGTLVDLTGRKASEAALERSEARLRLIVRNMEDGFFLLDAAWRFVEVNDAAARAMRRPAPDFIGRDLRELFPGVAQRVFGQCVAGVLAGGPPVTMSDLHPTIGRWYEARMQAAGDGVAVFFTDIHDRKQSEIVLAESERRFRSLVEDIRTIAVQGYDRERRVTFWNQASESLYGWSAAEAIGRPVDELLIPPEERAAFVEAHARMLRDGSSDTTSAEMVLVDRSGLPVPVYSSLVAQKRADGDLEFYCVDVDLRALRQVEAALQQANAALRQRNTELQQFVMIASHDLQEPLRKVQTFADRLQSALAGRLEPQEADYLERLLGAATRMRALIQDLLDYSAVSFNPPQRSRVDLDQVLDEVLDDLEQAIASSGATVRRGTLGAIDADPMQMRQLLQNLVGNAIKYRDPARRPQIVIDDGDEAATAAGIRRIRVADNGIGFDDAHRERIFAPFQRLHGRAEYGGTGIGLAIVRRIVDQHGGRIEARGKAGVGATFVVELPHSD